MNIPQSDQDNFRQALQNLQNDLGKAYLSATSVAAKSAIDDLTQDIGNIITSLNQAALNSATAEYAQLKASIDQVSAQLTTAQNQINNWVNAVQIGGQVVNDNTQVIAFAAKVVPV